MAASNISSIETFEAYPFETLQCVTSVASALSTSLTLSIKYWVMNRLPWLWRFI